MKCQRCQTDMVNVAMFYHDKERNILLCEYCYFYLLKKDGKV